MYVSNDSYYSNVQIIVLHSAALKLSCTNGTSHYHYQLEQMQWLYNFSVSLTYQHLKRFNYFIRFRLKKLFLPPLISFMKTLEKKKRRERKLAHVDFFSIHF